MSRGGGGGGGLLLRIGSEDWVEQGKILREKQREDRGGVLGCSVNIFSFFFTENMPVRWRIKYLETRLVIGKEACTTCSR